MKINVNLTPDTVALLLGAAAGAYRTISEIGAMLEPSDNPPTKEQILDILARDKAARDAALKRLEALP